MPRNPRDRILFEPVGIGSPTVVSRFYQTPRASGTGCLEPQIRARPRGSEAGERPFPGRRRCDVTRVEAALRPDGRVMFETSRRGLAGSIGVRNHRGPMPTALSNVEALRESRPTAADLHALGVPYLARRRRPRRTRRKRKPW